MRNLDDLWEPWMADCYPILNGALQLTFQQKEDCHNGKLFEVFKKITGGEEVCGSRWLSENSVGVHMTGVLYSEKTIVKFEIAENYYENT